ncbi:MAG: helix-turn-helix domain-containing protein [Clostridia bacterium]|nr:helix-turn-helix domain-containing protein [Clostridia bacterium]
MKDAITLKNIGQNIQKARIKKGMTQEQLAEICGVSSNHISMLETGKSTGSIPLIIDICNNLDVSPNYIFENTIKNFDDKIDVFPNDILITYLKLKEENKTFVSQTINHLYYMQKIDKLNYIILILFYV